MPPTCSMTKSDNMMIHQPSISPNDEAMRRHDDPRGYVERKKRADENISKRRAAASSRDTVRHLSSRSYSDLPLSEEDIRRRERAREAQERTVQHFEKSSRGLEAVSMHPFFPTAHGTAVSQGHYDEVSAPVRPSQSRNRPPTHIDLGGSTESLAGMERKQKERARQRTTRSPRSLESQDPRTSESALHQRLTRDEYEKERRLRDDGSNHDQLTAASGDSGGTGNRSARSNDSAQSREKRSLSTPRRPRPAEHQSSGRMTRRGSLGKQHASQNRRSKTPGKTSRANANASTPSRRSIEHTNSKRPPRKQSMESESSMTSGRGSHRDLDGHARPPPDRQLSRSRDSTRQFKESDSGRRQLMSSIKKAHASQASISSQRTSGTESQSRRHGMSPPRRTVSETSRLERFRGQGRSSASDSNLRSSERSDKPDRPDRLRHSRSRSNDGMVEPVNQSTRSRRIPRRRSIGDDTVDTRHGAHPESPSTSNSFAQAMKAFLLDGSVSGFNTEKEMEQRIAEVVFSKLRGKTSTPSSNSDGALQFDGSPAAGPPSNMATIVLTDVQGSTSLWEANPQAMQEALDLHDKILRRFCAFHNGYEIDTEGDAFFLAFHSPIDAFGFALGAQSALYDTEWSQDLLAIPAAAKEGHFSGLRVRMGIYHGPVTSCKNGVTGRTEYVGEAWNVAKCVEGMTHGGQILTTFETWNTASYKAEADLGSPQVVDLGCHKLNPKGSDESIERRIIQLVPASLSYDFFAARRLVSSDDSNLPRIASPVLEGRLFDDPITDGQVSASFHDAPCKNNEVTIAFVYFSEIENQYDDPKPIIASLIGLIGDLLMGTPGYHSQSNMLAFPDVNEAVKFGLRLMEELRETRLTDDFQDLSQMIKFGCVHDTFLTMGPHKTTGRADYFGKVVNRAARITAKSELGSVCFGVLADAPIHTLPKLDRCITSRLVGVKQLKGVQEEMALYECSLNGFGPLGLE